MYSFLRESYIKKNINKFIIDIFDEKYEKIYQNKIMSYGIRTLSEEVDEPNIKYDLEYVVNIFSKNWIDLYKNNDFNKNVENIATLKGLYVEPLLRGFGLAQRLLYTVEEYCKSKNCFILKTDVAHYSKSAIKFYEKEQFQFQFTTFENDDKLKIFHYCKMLKTINK